LSMKEKVGLFRKAKIVAGPSGGGMVNVLFSPPETKVISLDSPTFYDVNARWEYSLEHTDLYHFKDTEFDGDVTEWVEDQGALSISGGLNSPWKVNLDRLKEFVDTLN
jgi:capsular polysaccharide biosynthesis protein